MVLETRRATNTAVSPDGRFIAYSESGTDVAKMGPELWYASVDGRVPPRQFTSDPAAQQDPRFSPDGRDLAYVSFESGRQEVYVKTFPGAEGKWQISVNGGRRRGGAVAARCCSCSPARR